MVELDKRIALSLRETAEALCVSEGLIRKNLNIIPHLRFGSRLLFSIEALKDWLHDSVNDQFEAKDPATNEDGEG